MGRKDVIIKELIEEMIGMKIEKEAEEEKFTKFLLRDNRIDDLKRMPDDSDFRQKVLKEYEIN